jgi:serine/threonine protein kinase
MDKQQISVKAVFDRVVEIESPQKREAYLDEACAQDGDLRRKVNDLLKAHEEAGSFLESPAPGIGVTIDTDVGEGPGTIIGPYKLLQQIGEGGMGVVYMAEQTKPVKMRVALKIIKPGMDSKQVIARFETERTALALMEHPNIAKVLTAGTTESGRPFFAMELVKGEAITTYCDKHHLTLRERLNLFVSVCSAVQHAHQKGIIHRDLKPSNVLIARYDGKPVAKVIDFGVAKATGQQLTEKTLFTHYGQVVGTLEYMSPEQAEFNQQDIDTRSDIYSLGILLYQLLTGTTPFDPKRLRSGAWNEVMRIIREEEPPRPSVRLSSAEDTPSITAANCSTEPAKLLALLRGDLDWLIMKALAKERDRRYETANAFAADIERYLNGDAIEARPPSAAYRLRKTAARHRVALTTTAVVMVALTAGIVASSWMAVLMNEQRIIAVKAKDEALNAWNLATETLEKLATASYELAVIRALAGDKSGMDAAIEIADQATLDPIQIAVLEALALYTRGRFAEAYDVCERALANGPPNFTARAVLAITCILAGHDDQYPKELAKLEAYNPASLDPNEQLLMAAVMVYSDPGKALELLENVSDDQKSPLKLIVRAEARVHKSITSGNVELCYEALEDLERVEFIVGRSIKSQVYSLLATTYALKCANRDDRREEASRLCEEGRKLETWMKKHFQESSSVMHSRWFFLRTRGSKEDAWEAIKGIGAYGGTWCFYVAIDRALSKRTPLQALNDFDDAVIVPDNAYTHVARLILVALQPDGKKNLVDGLEACKDDSPLLSSIHAIYLTCLLGDRDQVKFKAKELIEKQGSEYFEILGMEDSLNCLAGGIEPSDLMNRAGDSRVKQCTAHFTAAMLHLCDGNRNEAMQSLQTSLDTFAVSFFEHELAEVFLKKLKDDPNWPGVLQ